MGYRTCVFGLLMVGVCATRLWAQGYAEPARLSPPADARPLNEAQTQPAADTGFTGNWRTPKLDPNRYPIIPTSGTAPTAAAPTAPATAPATLAPTTSAPPTMTPLAPMTGAPAVPGIGTPLPGTTTAPIVSRAPTPPKRPIAKVTNTGALPNDRGQVWREYDISPYTARVNSQKAEQAIIDWILRETGPETWHLEPAGVLTASKSTLKVYHTPQMHELISEIVDRFVYDGNATQTFGLRAVTVGSPTWRTAAVRALRPIPSQTPGSQAWLLSREDAAILLAELQKRNDFREHSAPQVQVTNGQLVNVSLLRPRNYVRNVVSKPNAWPGYETETAQLQEGARFEMQPLVALDSLTVEAIIKVQLDQVERMIPVPIDVPTPAAPRQKQNIEVPQLISCRLHEKFRWPTDQVLLISLGMVATPTQSDANPLRDVLNLPANARADALVFIDPRGKALAAVAGAPGVLPLTLPATSARPETARPGFGRGPR